MINNRVASLVARWRARGLRIRAGANELDLERFEGEHHLVLPADLRAFLVVANGMESEEIDPDTQIRFWSLSEIRSVAEELSGEVDLPDRLDAFFVFADYSLWAHAYAIRLSAIPDETNPVVIVGGDEPIQVATSFSHFLEKYLEDPNQLF